MNTEHSKALVDKHSEFFEYLKEHKGPIIPIQFGFECGDGWFTILDELMASIQNHIKNENSNRDHRLKHKFPKFLQKCYCQIHWKRKKLKKFIWWIIERFPRGVEHIPPIQITQVKEKFGGLCFYFTGGDDYILGMVSLAENLSYRTCELCGSTNDVGMTQGWLRAVCKSCYETDPWCEGREWKLGPWNVYRKVQEQVNELIEKHTKNGRKGSKKKES